MIILTTRFKNEVKKVLDYIAMDSKMRANKFYDDLEAKIADIQIFPLSYPKYKNRDDIRKLIFKGYVVPFRIKNGDIYILGIFKSNQWSIV